MTTVTSVLNVVLPQKCGHCAGGHESRDCFVKSSPGFKPECALCGGDHTAWNAACPARQKEMQRVEKAKQVRNHYWPTPFRRTTSTTNSHNQTGPTPPASNSDNANGTVRQNQPAGSSNQPIQEPRLSQELETSTTKICNISLNARTYRPSRSDCCLSGGVERAHCSPGYCSSDS